MRLTKSVPARHKALLTGLFGGERVVEGPVSVPSWRGVQLFEHNVLTDGQEATVVSERGDRAVVTGPCTVDVHPEGLFEPHKRIDVSQHEAVVLVTEDGKWNFILGKDRPVVRVKPTERLHQFSWTGGDELNKVPGALRFTHLRMQPQQAWVGVPVRSKDHCQVNLFLMVTWRVHDVEKVAMSSNDPMGFAWNLVTGHLTSTIGQMSFDEFLKDPAGIVEGHQLFKPTARGGAVGVELFHTQGIAIERVVLRRWEPTDRSVEQTLARSAVVQTERQLAKAQHDLALEKIGFERAQLEEAAKNGELKRQAAIKLGNERGEAWVAELDLVKTKLPEAATALLPLIVATRAQQLFLPPELLGRG
jgi:hypothetical protein